MPVHELKPTKRLLSDLYITKRLSTWKIGEITNVSRSHVRILLIRYGIPVRTRAEAHRRYERKPFDGSDEDKAYLLGFAIGDLRVRRQHDKSETIGIACSSTHPAQISLIYSLFSPYGRVWIGQANHKGVVACEAFVDLSFSFLHKENRNIEWIFETESHFYAFLAGFTDAEGCICFTKQNKITLNWGQYDRELLEGIRAALNKFGYRTGNVICDNQVGYVGKDGYVRAQNYHQLTCAARESLLALLVALKPYIRHDEKKQKLEQALSRLRSLVKSKT